MSDFVDKLNVLVRSSIHSILGDDTKDRKRRGELPAVSRLGKNIDREIAALRQQIDKALDDEDRQAAEINTLKQEIADLDQQADVALTGGDEATARHIIRQMQRQQQRVNMQEAELAQHRIATSELIHRVNELEAVVAEARRHQQTVEAEEGETLSNRLQRGLRQIEEHAASITRQETQPEKIDENSVEDDLAQRRSRLSQ